MSTPEASQRPPVLVLWTVYSDPLDFPGYYVARRFELDKATPEYCASRVLADVHLWIFEQASRAGQGAPICMGRHPDDDPKIIETWI